MRSGEIVFYVVAATVAFTIALQPRSLVAAALFVAVTAVAVRLTIAHVLAMLAVAFLLRCHSIFSAVVPHSFRQAN